MLLYFVKQNAHVYIKQYKHHKRESTHANVQNCKQKDVNTTLSLYCQHSDWKCLDEPCNNVFLLNKTWI